MNLFFVHSWFYIDDSSAGMTLPIVCLVSELSHGKHGLMWHFYLFFITLCDLQPPLSVLLPSHLLGICSE